MPTPKPLTAVNTQRRDANQWRTFSIICSIPKFELHHLAKEHGLNLKQFDTHVQRAAGMTALVYSVVGLSPAVALRLEKRFHTRSAKLAFTQLR